MHPLIPPLVKIVMPHHSRVSLIVPLLAALISATAALAVQPAKPGDIFKVNGKLAAAAILTTPSNSAEPRTTKLAHNSPMLRMLDGQIADIDRRAIATLRRFAQSSAAVGAHAVHVSTIHLLSTDAQDQTLELLDDATDLVWARRSDGSATVSIPRTRIDAMLPGWDLHQSGGISTPVPAAQIVDMPRPYAASSIRLDSKLIRDRLQGGDQRYPNSGLTRDLAEELLWLRLPKDHDPNQPAGVMVWVSPSPKWRIPPHFNAVLDELGLIACGADNADNPRSVTERLQLMFDALENLRSRYAIDEKRIYVTGFSGGARCASMLHLGWPEVFAGSLPIVGLNTYHRLDAQERGKIIPAQLGRPKGRRLDLAKANRMWAFTGETDFNLYEMKLRTDKLVFDGFDAKLTVVPNIGHEMPPQDDITQAVRWIDEDRRAALDTERDQAAAQLAAHLEEHPDSTGESGGALTPKATASLVEITRKWPWTDPAWQAAEMLGYSRPN